MVAREKKVREESKSTASEYLKKAADNDDQMLTAFHAENWNAAATLAVQCAISSADAICVYDKGVRSVSQDHLDVCDLVAQLPREGAKRKLNSYARLLLGRIWYSMNAGA